MKMTRSDSCILAVDAGGTSLKAALIPAGPHARNAEECAEWVRRSFFSVDVRSDGGREEILSAYRALGQKASDLASRVGLSILRAAVCTPGPFDYMAGCSLMRHKFQEIYGVPLSPVLQESIGKDCRVSFLHDSTAFLLGAGLSAPPGRRLCGVTIGTGLGFACMRDGKIRQNPMGGPAVVLYSRPYLRSTGESYVSKRGILNRYLERSQGASPELTVAEIAGLARAGDALALEAFQDTGLHLGRILLPVLRECQSDTVLLGGAISKSADLFLPQLGAVLSPAGIRAIPAKDIDLSPLFGAARYAPELTVCG